MSLGTQARVAFPDQQAVVPLDEGMGTGFEDGRVNISVYSVSVCGSSKVD